MLMHVTARDVNWEVDAPRFDYDWYFWDDWERCEWEPDTLEIVKEYARPGKTIVDIGAWIGPITMWAVHHGARVIAVEPDPVARGFLERNLADSGYENVDVYPGAISTHNGTCGMSPHEDGWASSMTQTHPDGQDTECVTITELFERYRIVNCALVKMDIEGAEADVLEDVAPFLASVRIPLLVSMHEPWWSRPVDLSQHISVALEPLGIGGFEQVLALPSGG